MLHQISQAMTGDEKLLEHARFQSGYNAIVRKACQQAFAILHLTYKPWCNLCEAIALDAGIALRYDTSPVMKNTVPFL